MGNKSWVRRVAVGDQIFSRDLGRVVGTLVEIRRDTYHAEMTLPPGKLVWCCGEAASLPNGVIGATNLKFISPYREPRRPVAQTKKSASAPAPAKAVRRSRRKFGDLYLRRPL